MNVETKEGDIKVSVPKRDHKFLDIDADTKDGEISVKRSIGGKNIEKKIKSVTSKPRKKVI